MAQTITATLEFDDIPVVDLRNVITTAEVVTAAQTAQAAAEAAAESASQFTVNLGVTGETLILSTGG